MQIRHRKETPEQTLVRLQRELDEGTLTQEEYDAQRAIALKRV